MTNKNRSNIVLNVLRKIVKESHRNIPIEELFPMACHTVDQMAAAEKRIEDKRQMKIAFQDTASPGDTDAAHCD